MIKLKPVEIDEKERPIEPFYCLECKYLEQDGFLDDLDNIYYAKCKILKYLREKITGAKSGKWDDNRNVFWDRCVFRRMFGDND